jgi:TM2 domain-containing membrane protein YozV
LDAGYSNRLGRINDYIINYSFSIARSDILIISYFASVVLFFAGIEKIITGIFIAHKARFATMGLGILTIILAGLAMAYPLAAEQ